MPDPGLLGLQGEVGVPLANGRQSPHYRASADRPMGAVDTLPLGTDEVDHYCRPCVERMDVDGPAVGDPVLQVCGIRAHRVGASHDREVVQEPPQPLLDAGLLLRWRGSTVRCRKHCFGASVEHAF